MLLTERGGLSSTLALPEPWYMAEVRVPLTPEASPTLAPAFTPSLACCFCPLTSLRPSHLPYSSVFSWPAQGQNL